jgi:hypothetical protein
VQQKTRAIDSRRVSVRRRGLTKVDIVLFNRPLAALDMEFIMIPYPKAARVDYPIAVSDV